MPRRSIYAALGLTLLAATSAAAMPSLRIGRGTPPPLRELRANETAGARVTDFRQREPNDGAPATLATAAEVTYDDDRLYITFVCEADPAEVRAHLARREGIRGDDTVAVWLDTFHDGHHAYVFYANPLGIQLDGLVTEGQDDDFSFDAVWGSEGHLTDTGYVVRLTIPFRSLRYRGGPVTTWGIALAGRSRRARSFRRGRS